MITYTGNGLNIIIECQHRAIDNWASFVSWYSIVKNLPDAEILIVCKRGISEKQYFLWPRRAKVNFFMYDEKYNKSGEKIIINPMTVALRDYDYRMAGPIDVASDVLATFVDYSNGFGKFVVSEWINNNGRPPFYGAVKKFSENDMSINETKLLDLWQQSCKAYAALEGI